jgi:hypothetical protein
MLSGDAIVNGVFPIVNAVVPIGVPVFVPVFIAFCVFAADKPTPQALVKLINIVEISRGHP